MEDEGRGDAGAGRGPEAEPRVARPADRRRRRVAVIVVALAAGIAALVWSTRRAAPEPPPAAAGAGARAPAAAAPPAHGDAVAVEIDDVILTAAARIQAEKFKCVCGCDLILAGCTCRLTPGSIDMKQHLQSLVSRGLSPAEIEKGMVERYGPGVIP